MPEDKKLSKSELSEQLTQLVTQSVEAAQAANVPAIIKIGREVSKIQALVKDYEFNEQKVQRSKFESDLTVAMQRLPLPKGLVITATLRRDDQGDFTDVSAVTTLEGILDIVDKAIGKVMEGAPTSVKQVTVSTDGEVKVGGTRTGGVGTGGKGWTKDGKDFKLAEIWNKEASDEQKASLANLEGNTAYTEKKKLASDKGYTQNS